MNFEEIKSAVQDAYDRYSNVESDLSVTLSTYKMSFGEIIELNFKWYVGGDRERIASLEYRIEEDELKCLRYYNGENNEAIFTDLTLEEFLQGVHKEFYNRGVDFNV